MKRYSVECSSALIVIGLLVLGSMLGCRSRPPILPEGLTSYPAQGAKCAGGCCGSCTQGQTSDQPGYMPPAMASVSDQADDAYDAYARGPAMNAAAVPPEEILDEASGGANAGGEIQQVSAEEELYDGAQ